MILRTHSELNEVIRKNPLPSQAKADPNKLLVNFLVSDPTADAQEKLMAIERKGRRGSNIWRNSLIPQKPMAIETSPDIMYFSDWEKLE